MGFTIFRICLQIDVFVRYEKSPHDLINVFALFNHFATMKFL